MILKNPKNPTVRQMEILQRKKLNPQNWRVIKHTTTEMEIINKKNSKIKKIKL